MIMIRPAPICYDCKHRHENALELKCDAFPNGIPDIIIEGNKHTKQLKYQRNEIVFEKKTDNLFNKWLTKC